MLASSVQFTSDWAVAKAAKRRQNVWMNWFSRAAAKRS